MNQNASSKRRSFLIVRMWSSVQRPSSRKASSNDCTIGHAKNSARNPSVGRTSQYGRPSQRRMRCASVGRSATVTAIGSAATSVAYPTRHAPRLGGSGAQQGAPVRWKIPWSLAPSSRSTVWMFSLLITIRRNALR